MVVEYAKESQNVGIMYGKVKGTWSNPLVGYCDSDYASNLDNRKSQSGHIFTLFGSAVYWKSSLQSAVALSTTEVEYISLKEAVKESKWLKGIIEDFGIIINCDSSGALCLAKHQVFHERSKHIDVWMHFIIGEVDKEEIKMVKISIDHNPADMLTKGLPTAKFKYSLELLNVVEK